jgi:hypothetical protein
MDVCNSAGYLFVCIGMRAHAMDARVYEQTTFSLHISDHACILAYICLCTLEALFLTSRFAHARVYFFPIFPDVLATFSTYVCTCKQFYMERAKLFVRKKWTEIAHMRLLLTLTLHIHQQPLQFSLIRVPFFLEPDYPRDPTFQETNRAVSIMYVRTKCVDACLIWPCKLRHQENSEHYMRLWAS